MDFLFNSNAAEKRYTLRDVCEKLDVAPHNLLYWSEHFKTLKNSDGSRKFSFTQEDVDFIAHVKNLTQENTLPFEKIKEQLEPDSISKEEFKEKEPLVSAAMPQDEKENSNTPIEISTSQNETVAANETTAKETFSSVEKLSNNIAESFKTIQAQAAEIQTLKLQLGEIMAKNSALREALDKVASEVRALRDLFNR